MEYAFTVNYTGVSEGHYNAIGTRGSGYSASNVSGGRRGTIAVDVVGINTDGSLQVRVAEMLSMPVETRPRQAYECSVYGTGVVCDQVNQLATGAEQTLMSYLGRNFVDGAPWDDKQHWHHDDVREKYTDAEDFTLVGDMNATIVTIKEHQHTVYHGNGFVFDDEDTTITYDRSIEAPRAIDDENQTSGGRGSGHSTYTFSLLSDSFSKPAATSSP